MPSKYGIEASEEAIKLCDDIFYGRADCGGCRREKKEFCNNMQCLMECKRMTARTDRPNEEQLSLF